MSQGCSLLFLYVVPVPGTDHKYLQTRAEQGSCPNREPTGEHGGLHTLGSVEVVRTWPLAPCTLHCTPGPQRVRDLSISPALSSHETSLGLKFQEWGQEGRGPAQGASRPGFAFQLFCFAMYSQVRLFPFWAFGLHREREGDLVRHNLLGMVDSHRPRGPTTGRDSSRGSSGDPGPGSPLPE